MTFSHFPPNKPIFLSSRFTNNQSSPILFSVLPPTEFWVPLIEKLCYSFRFIHFGISALWILFDDLLMSLAVGATASSSTTNMGNVPEEENIKNSNVDEEHEHGDDNNEKLSRQMSEASVFEDDDDDDRKIELGPQCTLKEQLEKDKDDESLRRWKEQLLGSVDLNSVGETLEADVKIINLAILSPGRPDIVLTVPDEGKPKGVWFTLKEGSHYSLKFSFKVTNNIVSGLRYTNTVWKSGLKVDGTKEMLGVYSPQDEPYTHEMPEETTPSGMFARGSYSARTKFLDDDNKCYLEINYTFDIRKEWASSS